MDRVFTRADGRTPFAVCIEIPAHRLRVTVLVAQQLPAPQEQVPGHLPRLAIPTGVPI